MQVILGEWKVILMKKNVVYEGSGKMMKI